MKCFYSFSVCECENSICAKLKFAASENCVESFEKVPQVL